jgi:hypothetical protein
MHILDSSRFGKAINEARRKAMRSRKDLKTALGWLVVLSAADAFVPNVAVASTSNGGRSYCSAAARRGSIGGAAAAASSSAATIEVVPTEPIQGMKPGTSGLRKKVEVWQGKNYLENFVQALIDTVIAKNDDQPPKS